MLPLRIAMTTPKVKASDVEQEIEEYLSENNFEHSNVPIPQQLYRELTDNPDDNPCSNVILRKAQKIVSELDSIFLPGGEDLPAALYGEKERGRPRPNTDYRRSIFEIALLHHAYNKGIPLMSICRGFQASNVFFGAVLEQHVDGHSNKIQRFKPLYKNHHGLLHEGLKNSIVAMSYHHQGVAEQRAPRRYLETIAVHKGIVKAGEPVHPAAAPMILLQYHPEYNDYVSKNIMGKELLASKANDKFWHMFFDSAQAYRNKKLLSAQLLKREEFLE
jgi:gamma-glutamyl-gamma-aminobutyrate hydrolase PuuD